MVLRLRSDHRAMQHSMAKEQRPSLQTCHKVGVGFESRQISSRCGKEMCWVASGKGKQKQWST